MRLAPREKLAIINMSERRRRTLEITPAFDPFSPQERQETLRLVDEALQTRRKVVDRLRPEGQEAEIVIRRGLDGRIAPIRFLNLADTHFGSDFTDMEALSAVLEDASKDHGCVVIACGDLLEGLKASPQFLRTNLATTGLNFDMQIKVFRARLGQVIRQGRLVLVGEYQGHDEWSKDLTLSATGQMVDEKRVPIVRNGGVISVVDDQGCQLVRKKVFHNPGASRSKLDPLRPLREQSRRTPMDDKGACTVFMGGHTHDAAVSKERRYDVDSGKDRSVVLLQGGTYKGTDVKSPDPFLTIRAAGMPGPGGVYTVLYSNDGDGEGPDVYPVMGTEKSKRLCRAIGLWERAEALGVTAELIGQIWDDLDGKGDQVSDSRVLFVNIDGSVSERSQRYEPSRHHDTSGLGEIIYAAPLHEKLSVVLTETKGLPVRLAVVGNVRVGSASAMTEEVAEISHEVATTRNAFLIAMRGMVDDGVGKREDRIQVLRSAAGLLREAAASGKLIGFLLDGRTLRSDDWKKKVGGKDGFSPGDYLFTQSPIKGVPLFAHRTRLVLALEPEAEEEATVFKGVLADHLEARGSQDHPFWGLIRLDIDSGVSNDFVVGGHMPGAGFCEIGMIREETGEQAHVVFIPTGWLSSFAESRFGGGKSNRRTVPTGGQGMVLCSDRTVFGASSRSELGDLHEALTILTGLKRLRRLTEVEKSLAKQ